jgi:hypothetical protein
VKGRKTEKAREKEEERGQDPSPPLTKYQEEEKDHKNKN